jgi:hypothetical protein
VIQSTGLSVNRSPSIATCHELEGFESDGLFHRVSKRGKIRNYKDTCSLSR